MNDADRTQPIKTTRAYSAVRHIPAAALDRAIAADNAYAAASDGMAAALDESLRIAGECAAAIAKGHQAVDAWLAAVKDIHPSRGFQDEPRGGGACAHCPISAAHRDGLKAFPAERAPVTVSFAVQDDTGARERETPARFPSTGGEKPAS